MPQRSNSHDIAVNQSASSIPGLVFGARRAIFLDRDGVINQNRPDHVKSWSEFVFETNVLPALARLASLHLPIIVITNQACIGRGLVGQEVVEDIHRRMVVAVEKAGGRIDHVLYCPHHPSEECACRKPKPGMLLEAAQRWNLDLSRSFLVGDAITDIQAGWAVGCNTVLVKSGRGAQQWAALQQGELQQQGGHPGDIVFNVAEGLGAAAYWINQQLAYEQLEHALHQAVPQLAIEA